MSLTKFYIATSIATLLLSTGALAAQPGSFAGVSLGLGDTHAPDTDKATDLAFGVHGGYNFNPYIGIEAQINDDASIVSTDANKQTFYDAALLVDGYYPLNNSFDLIGKAGIAATQTDIDFFEESSVYYRPKLVAGLGYTLSENWYSSLTYSRIFKKNNTNPYLPNINVVAISIDYLF